MLLRLAVRYLLRTVAVFALGASFASGCSRQGEGERCDSWKAGDTDCDSGLVCKRCEDLQDGTTDRCCPPGTEYSDARCQPGSSNSCSTNTGTGGTSATGGSAGSGGSAMSGSGGTSGNETGGTAGTDAETGGTGGTDGGDVGGQAGEAQAGTAGG